MFAAAFVAGAAAAVGVNRALDVRLAQSKPRVESEAIFVALRSLPQGAAVTVWDVALRDWPKAMMPASALRSHDTFSGRVLKHPLREGQPLLSIQLLPSGQANQPAAEASPATPPADYTRGAAPVVPSTDADLWAPAEPIKVAAVPPARPTIAPSQAPVAQAPVAQTTVPQTQTALSAPQAPAIPQPASEAVAPATLPETVAPAEPVAPSTAVTMQPLDTHPAADAETATVEDAGDTDSPNADSATASTSPIEEAVASTAPEVTAASEPNAPALAQETESALPAESTASASADPVTITAEPAPSATPPTAASRPMHGRYLVVPESIALKADTSFVRRADAQPQEAEPASRPNAPAAVETVRPLPPTTANRGPQSVRPSANAPQVRSPQRQGRQSPPVNVPDNTGRPIGSQPSRQQRFGTTMFPNLSAGVNAIEGRLRRDQDEPSQPSVVAKPITAR